MGVAIFVAVLVVHVSEHRALYAVFVNIDALVEPRLFELETMLGIVANFNRRIGVFVFDGDFADFNAVDNFVFLACVFGL